MSYVKLLYRLTLYINHDIVKRFSDVETKKKTGKKMIQPGVNIPATTPTSPQCPRDIVGR